jgi:hypothetical protein
MSKLAGLFVLAAAAVLPCLAHAGDKVPAAQNFQQSGCEITVFSDTGFGGQNWTTNAGWSDLGDAWTNKIKSVKVKSGVWRMFHGVNYDGDHRDMAPYDVKDLGPDWNGKIGSFLCVQQT